MFHVVTCSVPIFYNISVVNSSAVTLGFMWKQLCTELGETYVVINHKGIWPNGNAFAYINKLCHCYAESVILCFIIVNDSRLPSFFISSHGNNCSSVFASVWSEICVSLFPPLHQRMWLIDLFSQFIPAILKLLCCVTVMYDHQCTIKLTDNFSVG